MILAAGRGERLRPLTEHTPKPLLFAGRYRLIEHLLFSLARARFYDIVINISHLQEQFIAVLGNGQNYGVQITYSLEPEEGGLETGGGIYKALPLLGNAPFLVVNGDVWTDYPFQNLSHSLNGLAHLILVDNPSHNLQGDFHLTAENKVLSEGQPTLTLSGMGVYHPNLFADCKPGKFRLAPLLRAIMEQGLVTGEHYRGNWLDVGNVQRLEELNSMLNEK